MDSTQATFPRVPAPPRRMHEFFSGAKPSRARKESRKKPAPRSNPADTDPDNARPATGRQYKKESPRSPAAKPRSFPPSRSPDRSAPREAVSPKSRQCFRRKRRAPSLEAQSQPLIPESALPVRRRKPARCSPGRPRGWHPGPLFPNRPESAQPPPTDSRTPPILPAGRRKPRPA